MVDQQQNDDSNLRTDIELERLKMYQDSFKHMTTFSSGAIAVASAVTGALFLPKPSEVDLLASGLLLLAFGAGAAMLGLSIVPRYIDSAIDSSVPQPGVGPPSRLSVFLRFSVIFSYFGLIFFALFAYDNLR